MPWPVSSKPITISVFLFSTTLFFLLFPPNPNPSPNPHSSSRSLLEEEGEEKPTSCSSILSLPPSRRCAFSLSHCPSSAVLNYASLHFCRLRQAPSLSLPLLSVLLLLHFRLLSLSASSHFSPVVSRLSSLLRLSPSMAAVTLLALGNGAPDAFATLAALRSSPRSSNLPLAALLSAGAFVSAFVVGLVVLLAGPFPLSPAPFLRDVFFYLLAALALFYVYLSAEIYLWQAVGLVVFYAFFVGLVFWMDLGAGAGEARKRGKEVEVEMEAAGFLEEGRSAVKDLEMEAAAANASSSLTVLGKVARLWDVPIATLLKLTIPAASPSEWSRFYAAANIALCPLALLYSFNSFIPMDSQIVFFLPHSHFPLWSVVLFVSLCLAVAHFFLEKEPPLTEAEQIATTLFAFVMSVFWISTTAGELLNCLTAVGIIMDLPPAILGLTVLAWGNSVGDLVADVSLAKAGQPATAMAGCFAGPMFNMLVGLGTALVIETAKVYPGAYGLQFNISVMVAFVFLLLSLMGTLLVVTWSRFRVPRFWGFCLVGLYMLFTAVSLAIARFSG